MFVDFPPTIDLRLAGMRHRVVALALHQVVTFDLACAIQVFAHAPTPAGGPGHYKLRVCGAGPGRVRTGDGFWLDLDHGLDVLAEADTVVVPGYLSYATPPPPEVLSALSAAADRGARVMSICIGAFALAHAGLLKGRQATTHWAVAAVLAEQFPDTRVMPDVLYVDEGHILTSAGLAAGLDLCLHVVRRDHGVQVAAELARWNVVAPHRDGGQAQFVNAPVPVAPGTGLGETCAWAVRHLDQPIGLTELAAHAHLSERSLLRRFRAETGCSPKQWLLRARLHRARELLETTKLSIESIATHSGFPSAAALRAHFTTQLHTTPTAYRRSFQPTIETNH
jgi:transcriptional regulator GlxA family with amidase domain